VGKTSFFKQLYQFSDGQIELRALPSRTQQFFDIGDHGAIDNFCLQHEENIFFGVATRDGRGGTKENIVHIPALWCDVDFKDTPRELAHEKLKRFPFKPSAIIKSGGGIHLYWLLSESAEKRDLVVIEDVNKRIAAALGGDMAATDAARILRVPGTNNFKYSPPRPVEIVTLEDFTYTLDDFLEILPPLQDAVSKNGDAPENDTAWLSEAMQGCGEGDRNATAAKIAGYWINKLPAADVLQILTTWNQSNNPPLPDIEIQEVVKSVSRYEPEKEQAPETKIFTATQMIQAYRDHVAGLNKINFLTGVRNIDSTIRGVAGGEVLTLLGRAGTRKTGFAQNMMRNYLKNSSWGVLFFSLEMPVASLTERFFGIQAGEPGIEVEKAFADPSPVGMDSICQDFCKEYDRLFVVESRIGLSDIPTYIETIKRVHNVKIGLVVVDYLGLMQGPGNSEYEVLSRIATGAKAAAKMVSVPIVLLSQTSRQGGSGSTEVSMNMARGSGAIEEAADFVIGLFQIEDDEKVIVGSDEKPKALIAKILKNRKGPAGSMWKLDLNPETFQIGSESSRYFGKSRKNGSGY